MKVGKGRLWLDGSGNVTIPLQFSEDDLKRFSFDVSSTRKYNLVVEPSDNSHIVLEKVILSFYGDWKTASSFVGGVFCSRSSPCLDFFIENRAVFVAEVNRVRNDPTWAEKLTAAKKRIENGKKSSLSALNGRILTKKEIIFKREVQKLIDRGTSKERLIELINEAFVEGVFAV